MTKEFVSVYPEGSQLKIEARKALYQELIENDHCFGERGKGFVRALKALVFEGKIESYEQSIEDEEALGGFRDNDLGYMLPAYICLASPVVSEDFFVGVLSRYSNSLCINIAGDVFDRLDGSQTLSEDMFARVQCLVRTMDYTGAGPESYSVVNGEHFAEMFSQVLSRVCYRGTSRNCLFPAFLKRLDAEFAGLSGRAKSHLSDTVKLVESLFGSAPKTLNAYSDAGFLAFCQLYFSRQLSPDFLAYLDNVYQSIPEERRIRLDGNQILYFAEQA